MKNKFILFSIISSFIITLVALFSIFTFKTYALEDDLDNSYTYKYVINNVNVDTTRLYELYPNITIDDFNNTYDVIYVLPSGTIIEDDILYFSLFSNGLVEIGNTEEYLFMFNQDTYDSSLSSYYIPLTIYTNYQLADINYNVLTMLGSVSFYVLNYSGSSYENGFNDGVQSQLNYNGIWSNIYYLEVAPSGNDSIELSLAELKTQGYLNDTKLSLYPLSLLNNDNYSSTVITIYFDNKPFNISELDLIFIDSDLTLDIGFTGNYSFRYSVNNLDYIVNYETLINNSFFEDSLINSITLIGTSPDSFNYVINNSDYNEGYNAGYNIGYNAGVNSSNNSAYENGYNDGYNEGLEDNVVNQESIDNAYLEGYNEGYTIGVEEDITTNGLKTLFITIMSYPVNMIRESFNFTIFGVNLSSLIMFIVSVALIWFIVNFFRRK